MVATARQATIQALEAQTRKTGRRLSVPARRMLNLSIALSTKENTK